MFAKFDRSGDTEEFYDEAFRVFDKEGSGQVTAAEMRDKLTKHGEKMTDVEVDAFLAYAEPDSKGDIDYKSMFN